MVNGNFNVELIWPWPQRDSYDLNVTNTYCNKLIVNLTKTFGNDNKIYAEDLRYVYIVCANYKIQSRKCYYILWRDLDTSLIQENMILS